MTKSRQEIKEYAKQAFKAQKRPVILGMFLAFLPLVGLAILTQLLAIPMYVETFGTFYTMLFNINVSTHFSPNTFAAFGIGYLIVWTLNMGVLYFLFPVLNTNLRGFFIKVFYGQPIKHSEPYTELKVNYGRKLGGYYWVALWLSLWSLVAMPAVYIAIFAATLSMIPAMMNPFFNIEVMVATMFIVTFASMSLLLIPIIIKNLAYCMSPHIIAAHPNVTAINALKLSKRMTKGYRGKIFVMWLSFLGWHILNVLTLGILGVFFVGPYFYTTMAGYFIELRNTAVSNGTIHPSEFEGFVPYSGYYPQYSQQQQYQQAPQYPQQQQLHGQTPQQTQPPTNYYPPR